jgi:hypothetical protein
MAVSSALMEDAIHKSVSKEFQEQRVSVLFASMGTERTKKIARREISSRRAIWP